MKYDICVTENGRFVGKGKATGQPMPADCPFPFAVRYDGEWRPAAFNGYGILTIDLARPLANIPQAAKTTKKTGAALATPRRPQAAPRPAMATITYEQWLQGEAKAPRGMGAEWQARRKCENAIGRMKRFSNSNSYARRYQAGSYNYRRAAGAHGDRRAVWTECISTAEAVVAASDGQWIGKWDIIKDVMSYATSMFSAYGL